MTNWLTNVYILIILELNHANSFSDSLEDSSTIISLDHISYSYPTRPTQTVIKNISLKFKKDSIHVIVGKSGSGKSTLLSLLCGLYEPTIGEINVPNETLSNSSNSNPKLDLDWVHKNVSYS